MSAWTVGRNPSPDNPNDGLKKVRIILTPGLIERYEGLYWTWDGVDVEIGKFKKPIVVHKESGKEFIGYFAHKDSFDSNQVMAWIPIERPEPPDI